MSDTVQVRLYGGPCHFQLIEVPRERSTFEVAHPDDPLKTSRYHRTSIMSQAAVYLIPPVVDKIEDEQVNHPTHYGGDVPYEPIKVIEAWGLVFMKATASSTSRGSPASGLTKKALTR